MCILQKQINCNKRQILCRNFLNFHCIILLSFLKAYVRNNKFLQIRIGDKSNMHTADIRRRNLICIFMACSAEWNLEGSKAFDFNLCSTNQITLQNYNQLLYYSLYIGRSHRSWVGNLFCESLQIKWINVHRTWMKFWWTFFVPRVDMFARWIFHILLISITTR